MSLKFGILADDLSGSNGIGVEFARHHMATMVTQDATAIAKVGKDIDVLIVDTESRYDAGDASFRKTLEAARALAQLNPACVVKKIDSLLRGPIGFDIDAIMQVYGFDKCLFAAASPKMGRITIGGYQLVEGCLLTTQMRSVDPSGKAESSYIPSILSRQSGKSLGLIATETVSQGLEAIVEFLKTADAQILVADSASQYELNNVVAAAYAAGIRFFAGSYGLGEALHPFGMQEVKTAPILVVAGSTSDMTRKQVARLERETGFKSVVIRFGRNFFHEPVEQFAVAIEKQLAGCGDVVIHTSGSYEEAEQLWRWAEEEGWSRNALSERIEQLIQHLVRPFLPKCDGFVFSGGATANSVFKLLNADGLSLTGQEVLPATPLTYVCGGAYHGLPYLTKPGSFGSEDDLVTMIKFMKNEIFRRGSRFTQGRSSDASGKGNRAEGDMPKAK